MIVLCCGDRKWTCRRTIYERLTRFKKPITIIHGDCQGADRLSEQVGKHLKIVKAIRVYPANWKKDGKRAGPIRNRKMLDKNPKLVLAFHNNIKKSKGTKDCVTEARRRGIRVEVIREGAYS